jgi:hypothetical protein
MEGQREVHEETGRVLWVKSLYQMSAEDRGVQHRLERWVWGEVGLTESEILHLLREMAARSMVMPETNAILQANCLDDVESWRDEAFRMISLLEDDIAELKGDLRRGDAEQAGETASNMTGRADFVQEFVCCWERAEQKA